MPDTSSQALADLMRKRRRCLEQLRALGLRQAESIEAGDLSGLLGVIAAKQQLIVALQAVEKQLAPFHQQQPEARDWPSAAARAQCAADAEACRQLIEEVMAMETEGQRQIAERRDAVAGQLRTAAAASRVREAYMSQK
ncbi:MAG: hypothetical protein DCC67_08670 [Planctomycetota bacterium]|nr:MAG: hypothetical protein DCC67_08670 [Planctomycetota bacterium]